MSAEEKKIAVILSGCGVFDGSEIHEAACTLLNIAEQGAAYQCFAPILNKRRSLTIIPKALSRTKAETCWSKRPALPAATSKAWPTLIPIF